MLRWFYANEELICQKRASSQFSRQDLPPEETILEFTWRFCVTLKEWDLMNNEVIAITGDCDELGNWNLEKCVQMEPAHERCLTTWHTFINLIAGRDISYRYLILAIDPTNNQKIIRFFESHLKTRSVPAKMNTVENVCEDIFGFINNEYKVERGWVTSERIVQFMFSKAYFDLKSSDLTSHTLSVKVTPYFRKGSYNCVKLFTNDDLPPLMNDSESTNSVCTESKMTEKNTEIDRLCAKEVPSYTQLDFSIPKQCLSEQDIVGESTSGEEPEKLIPPETDTQAEKLSMTFAFNEAVNTSTNKGVLRNQPQFGTKCYKDDVVTIHLTIGDFNNTVYLVELFMFSKFGLSEHPCRFGYRYVMPEDFSMHKQGYMEIPIICETKHRPIGFITFRFLIIEPIRKFKFDLSASYLRHWRKRTQPIISGHRGMGKSFIDSDDEFIYENTIYSMVRAIESGVDMVEFDVHLTKDLIPVINHDFNVHVSLRDQKLLQNNNHINIPLGEFTYAELMDLKVCDINNKNSSVIRIGDARGRQRLFPKLSEVLDSIDVRVAMDIEIKSPQQFCGSKWEEDVRPTIDHNIFVDRVLEVVIPRAKQRRIVFSSFDADIVTLLRFKQNRYPIMLNINDDNSPTYLDPRVKNPTVAVSFAHNMELLGVVFKAATILRNPIISKKSEENELVVFTYGVENFEDIKDLKHLRVNGLILDRIDKFFQFQIQNAKHTSGDGESQQERR